MLSMAEMLEPIPMRPELPDKQLLQSKTPSNRFGHGGSWHQPKRPFSQANSIFNDSRNTVSFVDGHVNYIKIYWDSAWPQGTLALAHDPPAGYDYKWSGN
jgi:prepilin-type processing-associated H-X9-DG protein